jgi:hypothetical protein
MYEKCTSYQEENTEWVEHQYLEAVLGGFVVDKGVLGQVVLRVLRVYVVNILHSSSAVKFHSFTTENT